MSRLREDKGTGVPPIVKKTTPDPVHKKGAGQQSPGERIDYGSLGADPKANKS